jgi:hypothetical protein
MLKIQNGESCRRHGIGSIYKTRYLLEDCAMPPVCSAKAARCSKILRRLAWVGCTLIALDCAEFSTNKRERFVNVKCRIRRVCRLTVTWSDLKYDGCATNAASPNKNSRSCCNEKVGTFREIRLPKSRIRDVGFRISKRSSSRMR